MSYLSSLRKLFSHKFKQGKEGNSLDKVDFMTNLKKTDFPTPPSNSTEGVLEEEDIILLLQPKKIKSSDKNPTIKKISTENTALLKEEKEAFDDEKRESSEDLPEAHPPEQSNFYETRNNRETSETELMLLEVLEEMRILWQSWLE